MINFLYKKSFEVVLEGSNQLNRKLEDAVAVGHEFAPIAGLWSQLDVIMRAAGIPDLAAQVKDEARRGAASTTVGAGSGDRALTPAPATPAREGARTPTTPGGLTDATPRAPDASTRASLRASMGLDGDEPNNKLIHHEDDLPPGVAPGSGFVYGRE